MIICSRFWYYKISVRRSKDITILSLMKGKHIREIRRAQSVNHFKHCVGVSSQRAISNQAHYEFQ